MILSFIIPVYKTPEQLLRNCLDSVLKYSRPMELICVLDSPGDPCEKVLDEYVAKDQRVRLVKNDCNRGVSYSRNRGLEFAKGYYVAFVDADDEIMSEAYEQAEAFSRKNQLDGCAVAPNNSKCCARAGVKYGGRVFGTLKDPHVGRILAAAFGWSVYPKILRSSLLVDKHLRFVEGRRYGEDFIYMTNVLCRGGNFGFINEDGYKSVGHPGSTCKAVSDVDNYVQGLRSSLDVLNIAVKSDIAHSVKSWYLARVLQLSLLCRPIRPYIRASNRQTYCCLLRAFFDCVARNCADVAPMSIRLLAFCLQRWPRLWFAPGEPGSFLLKILDHFNALAK